MTQFLCGIPNHVIFKCISFIHRKIQYLLIISANYLANIFFQVYYVCGEIPQEGDIFMQTAIGINNEEYYMDNVDVIVFNPNVSNIVVLSSSAPLLPIFLLGSYSYGLPL